LSRSRDEYESRLDAASYESRLDPLRDAAHEVVLAWQAEDNQEKNDLSERIWQAIANLASVLVSSKRGEPVPTVEVTQTMSPVPVGSPERPLDRRRSAAKNISDPVYQSAFISEARASRREPDVETAREFLGRYVRLEFNVDWHPAKGVLTDVITDDLVGGNLKQPYLLLDNYRERIYPLNAVTSIQLLDHVPGSHPSTP